MKTTVFVRRITMALTLLLAIAIKSNAQADSLKHSPEKRAQVQTDKMKTNLTLSDDQYKKIYDINLKYAKKRQESMQAGDDRRAKMKEMKVSNDDKNNELKAVLSEDQFTKYQEMQKEMKAKRKNSKV